MTAEQAYIEIKSMLQNLGLREIPNLHNADEVKESHNADGFILQPTETEEAEYVSSGLMTSYQWKLEVIFKHNNSLERAQKFDRFNVVKQALQQLSGFIGFTAGTSFERLADFTFVSIGTINFKYGILGSC